MSYFRSERVHLFGSIISMKLCEIFLVLLLIRLHETKTYPCSSSMTCGCSSKLIPTSRIVGGQVTQIKMWPWTVSISVDGNELCAGTILSSEWIVTAAHCAPSGNISKTIVHAGSNFRWTGTQQRNISKVIVHPQYQDETFSNDIALFKLATPLDMSTGYLAPICLPDVDTTSMKIDEWPADKTPVEEAFLL